MNNLSVIRVGSGFTAEPDYPFLDSMRDVREPAVANARRSSLYATYGKRILDIAIVLFLSPVILCLIAIMALFICVDGHSPFYAQKRVGFGGRMFRMWKLRSMVPDADAGFEAYLAENPVAREEWDRTQKLRNDPRITPVGRFIRKTSIDELPQMWNVLTGEMSLIGPRPFTEDQRDIYPGKVYYDMRPGVSGLWQVSERNESSFVERAVYDEIYHRSLSPRADFHIFVKTFGAVMGASGH